MPAVKTWTCNACDHEGKTSREHLLHVAIGRVILRNRDLSREDVRAHLQSDYFRHFGVYEDIMHEEPNDRAWLNQAIRGLICEECNRTWARQLEEDAGANLYDFTNLRGPANAAILRRWAWFFAMKLWFMNSRTEDLASGPLRPVLRQLADPNVNIQMPVVVARISGSQREWAFAASSGWRGSDTPHMAWIMRGVVWMVCATDEPTVTLPIKVTPLHSGLRLHRVNTIKQRQIVALVSTPPADMRRQAAVRAAKTRADERL